MLTKPGDKIEFMASGDSSLYTRAEKQDYEFENHL